MATEACDMVTFFPLFLHLPSEIRLLIWEYALPEPRVVYLEYYTPLFPKSLDPNQPTPGEDEAISQSDTPPRGFRTRSTISLASVCRESRDVVQETYCLAFCTDYAPATTWFDFRRDTLYLDWGYNGQTGDTTWARKYVVSDLCEDIKLVEKLAVNAYRMIDAEVIDQENIHQYTWWISCMLSKCNNLKVLSLVDMEEDINTEPDLALVNESGIIAALYIFETTNTYHPDIELRLMETERKFIGERLFLNAHVDLGLLESFRNGESEDGRSPLFQPCPMQWQGITTRHIKERYELARRSYYEMKESYRVSLLLRSVDHRAIMVSVAETTPLSEIVEEYRGTVGVSHKSVFVGISFGNGMLDPRLNSTNYSLMSGATLDIFFSDKKE